MYTIYLSLVIGIIIGVLFFYNSNTENDKFLRSLRAMMISFACMTVGVIIAGLATFLTTPELTYDSESIEILSLQDNTYTEGSFVLGSGNISSEDYYSFYRKTNNGIQRDMIRSSMSTIQYTSENPNLEIVYQTKSIKSNWTLPFENRSIDEYILKIPQGAVQETFTLDTQ